MKKYLLLLIILNISGSLLLTVIGQTQTDIYAGLPPTPPVKRILYTWNMSDCWDCHYIPAPMPPETIEIPYRKRPSFSIEAERGLWRLTYGSGNNIGAVWSPDGSKIAYVSDRFGNWTLHVIDVESGDDVQLTSPDSISGWPDWSPDGARIAYWSYRDNESQLYVIRSDGTDDQQLTSGSLLKSEPLWKSDGIMLLFGQKDEYWQIWIMALDSGKQWQVSTADEDHWAPRWMSDGKEIIYYSSDGFILKTVDIDSQHYRYVTSVPSGELVSDERPRISPDGKKMLFSSLRSPNWGLWLMDIDGKNTKRLTHDGAGDRKASWSPDGKKIIYSSYRSGDYDIWLMNSDGSDQTRLIKSRFDEFSPSWHPSGRIAAYESNIGGKFDIWLLEIDSPLEVDVNFQRHTYQNSSSETKFEFSSRVEGTFQIEAVRLHFDWPLSEVDNRIAFTPPVQLTSPSIKEVQSVSFEIPTDITLGYHFYNLIVEYRQVIDGSFGPLRTYRQTAKDLSIAPQERNIYETLHEKVASEIKIQNKQAQEEGYSDLLVEGNQNFLLAERLALEGKLTEATEYLRLTQSLLIQNLPEEKPAYSPITMAIIGILAFFIIILVFVVRKIRFSKKKNI